MFGIPLQASVAEIEKVLRRELNWSRWEYLKDHHFEHYVADQVATLEDALAFADLLEAECLHGCSKARTIRSYLCGEFWRQGTRFRSVLGHARRIHCCSHEAGSFYFTGRGH